MKKENYNLMGGLLLGLVVGMALGALIVAITKDCPECSIEQIETFNETTLYYSPTCPYCIVVLEWLEENPTDIRLCNVAEDEKCYEKYKSHGFRGVPALVAKNGSKIVGDVPIINFLGE